MADKKRFEDMLEIHCTGMIVIDNLDLIKGMVTSSIEDMKNADLGIMINQGNVWICVNGIALLRFKEQRKKKKEIALLAHTVVGNVKN